MRAAERGVLRGGFLQPAGEVLVQGVQLVCSGCCVGGVYGIELLAELMAQGCLEPVAFVAEFLDFLPGDFEFGAQAEWGGRACAGRWRGAVGLA